MKAGKRDDPTKCGNGLHEWNEENVYTNPNTGQQSCRACKIERSRKDPSERHSKGSGHCRRGHAYTLENTEKRAKILNGKKYIERHCLQCRKDRQKTGFQR